MNLMRRVVCWGLLAIALPPVAFSQEEHAGEEQESKRLFLIIPNYRTAPSIKDFQPISSKEKFKIAFLDASDRGTIALGALFGGEQMLVRANPSFGYGGSGYARYFATAYSDFVIGDFMTEGVFPSLLHQDPRYFRMGTGGGMSRLRYAMGQIFITHDDSGHRAVNWSELLGNASAVAISNAYYPDNRTAHDAAFKLGTQFGVDMASNILKEFWPEISHRFSHKKRP